MFPVVDTFKRLLNGTQTGKWVLGSVAAAALTAPSVAHADHIDRPDRGGRVEHREIEHREIEHRDYERREIDRHDFDRHDRDGRVGVDIRIGARPEYEEREVRVWVPPVYRTECEQVWVPDQFEDREVRFLDRGRWCTRIDHVLVVPGHYESRDRQVCVTEGHYETHVERVRVADRIAPIIGGFGIHLGR